MGCKISSRGHARVNFIGNRELSGECPKALFLFAGENTPGAGGTAGLRWGVLVKLEFYRRSKILFQGYLRNVAKYVIIISSNNFFPSEKCGCTLGRALEIYGHPVIRNLEALLSGQGD